MATSGIDRPRILIEGIGAMGGVAAGRLLAAGFHPTLVAGNDSIAAAVNKRGITLREDGRTVSYPVTACRTLEQIPAGSRFDFAFLVMKANRVVEAARNTMRFLDDEGCLISFQNGVVEPLIADAVGTERVIGAVLHWAATMKEPGLYEPTVLLRTILGELDGRQTARLSRLAKVVERITPVVITNNILGALWSKLALNCTITTMGGLTGQTLSEMLASRTGRELFLAAYREVVDAATAQEITLAQATVDPYAPYLPRDAGADRLRAVDEALASLERAYGKSRPSILQSLERRRKTEVDFINGHVVAAAQRSGGEAPVNAAITRMIHEIEDGIRPITPANLDDLARAVGG